MIPIVALQTFTMSLDPASARARQRVLLLFATLSAVRLGSDAPSQWIAFGSDRPHCGILRSGILLAVDCGDIKNRGAALIRSGGAMDEWTKHIAPKMNG
jgi:hypothetical protein